MASSLCRFCAMKLFIPAAEVVRKNISGLVIKKSSRTDLGGIFSMYTVHCKQMQSQMETLKSVYFTGILCNKQTFYLIMCHLYK